MVNRVDISIKDIIDISINTLDFSCVSNVFKSVNNSFNALQMRVHTTHQNLLLNTARGFRRHLFSLKYPLEILQHLLTLLLSLVWLG